VAKSSSGKGYGGAILHFHAVRGRITGSGILRMRMLSLDDINWVQLPDLVMLASTNREPNTLVNYSDQRGQLEFKVTGAGEFFTISGLNIFIKPVATGYPQ